MNMQRARTRRSTGEGDADVAAPTLETLHKRHRNRTIFDYLLSGRDRSAARGTWEPTTMIPITNRRRRSFNVIAFPLGDPGLARVTRNISAQN
jgi:hypothetical protein